MRPSTTATDRGEGLASPRRLAAIVTPMTSLRLIPVPALRDNYIWLMVDAGGNAIAVDPGDAEPVLSVLASQQLRLRTILLTHHHHDHVGGVAGLLNHAAAEVYAPVDARISQVTHRVSDGERIVLPLPAVSLDVLAVPGHTLSHVAYHGDGVLFSGDTLFSLGCGRLFEGSPAQMLASLQRLAALPAHTQVCCGHEYTLENGHFASSVEPNNPDLAMRIAQARSLRAQSMPTLPSSLAEELACNPFLRTDTSILAALLDAQLPAGADSTARFALLRRLKDDFRIPSA